MTEDGRALTQDNVTSNISTSGMIKVYNSVRVSCDKELSGENRNLIKGIQHMIVEKSIRIQLIASPDYDNILVKCANENYHRGKGSYSEVISKLHQGDSDNIDIKTLLQRFGYTVD